MNPGLKAGASTVVHRLGRAGRCFFAQDDNLERVALMQA